MNKTPDSYHLITRYFDDSADEEDMRTLNSLLESDVDVQDQLIELSVQTYAIAEELPEFSSLPTPHRKRPIAFPQKIALAAAACVALSAGVIYLVMPNSNPHPVAAPLAMVVQSSGQVDFPPGAALWSGGVIRTHGPHSSLNLEFADGTTLYFAGDSVATIEDHIQKRISVSRGSASLNVTPQSAENPLVLTTGNAELTVKGTSFSVSTQTSHTQLEVGEGAVALTRLSDGQSVFVDAGHYSLISEGQGSFTPNLIPKVSDRWSLDFRDDFTGLMKYGVPEQDGNGLTTGIRAEVSRFGMEGIAINKALDSGEYAYFKISSGRTLYVRYKMDAPAWWNFIVVCRTPDPGTATQSVVYQNHDWWQGLEPDEWRTIAIPLDSPRDVNRKPAKPTNVPLGWNALSFSFSAGNEIRGFVVERMWIE